MTRRGIAAAFAAVLLLATPAMSAAAPPVPRGVLRGWNIVLITLDATDPARIGAYGGSPRTMPYFDELARNGLLVMNAYTLTGSTAPAHATLFSGLSAAEHGVRSNGLPLAGGVFWLPEMLREQGYVTAGSTVAFFMNRTNGFSRGFDCFEGPAGDDDPMRRSNRAAYRAFEQNCLPMLSAEKPFFAFIHLKGGHAPLAPVGEAYLRRHSRSLPPDRLPPIPTAEQALLGQDDAALRTSLNAYYDASLSEADDTLRLLFQQFKTRGLTRKTLFIITADHGESFDHGFHGEHWPSPWQSTLRVPLLFHTESGALSRGRISDRLFSHADLVPTLSHLFAFPVANRNSGEAFNLFGATKRTAVEAASVNVYDYEHYVREMFAASDEGVAAAWRKDADDLERRGAFYWSRIEMAPDGIFKLLHFGATPRSRPAETPMQLFDLSRDPGEQRDLLRSGGGKRTLAAAMLGRARSSDFLFGHFLADLKPSGEPARDALRRQLDDETIKKLKALGYLQ